MIDRMPEYFLQIKQELFATCPEGPSSHRLFINLNMHSVTFFETQLLTSSSSDAAVLHSTNRALKEILQSGDINAPVKKYVSRLAKHSERLNSILRQEN